MTGGRAWAARLSVLVALGAIVGLIVAIVPVLAGAGGDTALEHIYPYEIDLGGQPGDCDAVIDPTDPSDLLDNGANPAGSYPGLPAAPAAHAFRIVNLRDGVDLGGGWIQHTDPVGGLVVNTRTYQGGKLFDFEVVSSHGVADVIVNGGSDSTHFVYTRYWDVAKSGYTLKDDALHAPAKSSGTATNYHSTSHVEICYDDGFTISGAKFYDWNMDGNRDAVDNGLIGWTINAFEAGGGPLAGTGETIADGTYTIPALPPGDYDVCETLKADWTQSFPGGGGCHAVTLNADVGDVDFGNYHIVTLSGIKFNDKNLDGNQDGGEEAVAGFTITVTPDGSQPAGAPNTGGDDVSDANGAWSLEVHAGEYSVSETGIPAGVNFDWVQSPNSFGHADDYQADAGDLDFGNYKQVTLEGIVFHDRDNDGDNLGTEEGLTSGGGPDWRVSVSGLPAAWTGATSADPDGVGFYTIDVPAGSLTLCVALPAPVDQGGGVMAGWEQSTPTGTACSATQGGHGADYQVDTGSLDFGATEFWTIPAGQTATLGGGDEPESMVTVPASCSTPEVEGLYDVGVNRDEGDDQFVLFGGDPGGNCILTQTIWWAPEIADYDVNMVLQVPTTLVRLTEGGQPEPVQFCNPLGGPPEGGSRPNSTVPDCLDHRIIEEGNVPGSPVPPGKIQLHEVYLFLGDPPRFR